MPDKPAKLNLKKAKPRGPRPQYGRLHRKNAAACLAANPICTRCGAAFAVHAHHLIPNATTPDHYQALCQECHALTHKEE